MPVGTWDRRLERFAAGPFAGAAIALLVVVAYWPLSTFSVSISAGDTLDCWLPWRHFIAAALHDGAFPAWNPYQQMGYPVHADLQGPAWYPEALILGGTIGHGVHLLSILFLAYLALAGEGMRRLVLYLHGDAWSAWLAGMAFALGGFFTGHAMHFYAVIGAAWMPWLFWSVLRLLDEPSPRRAFITAVLLFLLLTGGNHTFLIMAAYPLASLGLHAMYRAWRAGDRTGIVRLLRTSSLAVAAAALMAMGTLHAVWEVSPYLARAKGLSLEEAGVNPFTLRAAWSMVLPWSAASDATGLGTDPTMANGHFGLLMLMFAMLGMMRPMTGRERILLVTVAVSGMASLGSALPVHGWLWRWLPGMDLFRFPAYFQYFVVLGLLPFAAKGLAAAWRAPSPGWRRIVFVMAGVVLLLMGTSFGGWGLPGCPACSPVERLAAVPVDTKVVLNGVLALVLIGVASVSIRGERAPLAIGGLVLLEMILAVQVTQWHTALGLVPPSAIQYRIDALPGGPVLPQLEPMGGYTDVDAGLHHLWRNTAIFRGRPSHDGFNSFWLEQHQSLRSHTGLFQAMRAQPVLYLARHIVMAGDTTALSGRWPDAPAVVELPWLARAARPARPLDRMHVEGMDHRSFTSIVTVADTSLMVVQQNLYPGWGASVDGTAVPVHRVNGAAFGVMVPPGEHRISVRFHKPLLSWLLLFSYGTFFLVLFGLAWTARPRRIRRLVLPVVLLSAFLWSMMAHRSKADRIAGAWTRMQEHVLATPGVPVLVNTDRAHRLGVGGGVFPVRIEGPDRTAPLDTILATARPDSLWLAWAGLPLTPAMQVWAMDHYGPPVRRVGNADAGAWLMTGRPSDGPAPALYGRSERDTLVLSDPGSPYTAAIRIPRGVLDRHRGKQLCIDLHHQGGVFDKGRLVIEQKQGDRTLDYEAVPLHPGGGGWRHDHIVRPIALLAHGVDEVVCYVWNASGMPLRVTGLRVRIIDLER